MEITLIFLKLFSFLFPMRQDWIPKKVPIPCNTELDLQASVCHFCSPLLR